MKFSRNFQLAVIIAGAAAAGLVPAQALAYYYPSLYTSTRADAMGGAYVALADDESAIFMNPAGLAGIKGFTFNYAAVDTEISTDDIAVGLGAVSGAIGGLTPSTLNTLMGKDIYVHAQATPSFVMPNFGVALISDQQFSLIQQNVADPNIGLQLESTNGIQAAYGTSLIPKRKRKRYDIRVGIAAKMLWRRGGYYNLDTYQVIGLTQDPIDGLHNVVGGYGLGYGVDMGTQYIYQLTKTLSLASALVMTDIGNTAFSSVTAMPQVSNMTWGMAATYNLRRIKFNYAFDMQHLMQDGDFREKMHTGIEMQVPFFSVMTGLNQMNFTYGASFDIWLFKITAAYYGEELDAYGGQNTEDRYAVRIQMKIGI